MTLFFILLIALVVYQFTTRKSLSQIYPQFDRRQIRRLTDAPFYVTGWTLLFVFVAYALSALTAMIGELFNVDNYIAIFSGGWLGLILQFLPLKWFHRRYTRADGIATVSGHHIYDLFYHSLFWHHLWCCPFWILPRTKKSPT